MYAIRSYYEFGFKACRATPLFVGIALDPGYLAPGGIWFYQRSVRNPVITSYSIHYTKLYEAASFYDLTEVLSDSGFHLLAR